MKIKKRYTVVRDEEFERFVFKISDLINKGCVPLGGMNSFSNGIVTYYEQTLWLPDNDSEALGYFDNDPSIISSKEKSQETGKNKIDDHLRRSRFRKP